jgi:Fe2+ or Zn2+ uptake regulation protein
MRQLTDSGKILQIAVENDVSRYDGNTKEHQHFICDTCSRIFDVNIDFAEGSEKSKSVVESMYKHSVDRCVVSFYGTCANCVGSSK